MFSNKEDAEYIIRSVGNWYNYGSNLYYTTLDDNDR